MSQKLKYCLKEKKWNIVISLFLFVLCAAEAIWTYRMQMDALQANKKMFFLLHIVSWMVICFLVMWGNIRKGYVRWRYILGALLFAAGIVGSVWLEVTANYQLLASMARGMMFLVLITAIEVILFPGMFLKQIFKFERHRDYLLVSFAFIILEMGIDRVLPIVDISFLYSFVKNAGQIVLALVWIRYCRFLKKRNVRGNELIILLVAAVVNCFMFNVAVGGYAILKLQWQVPMFLVMWCLYSVTTCRTKVMLYIGEGVMIVLAVVNGYVIQFRGTPIMPDDIYAAATAVNVAGNYSYVPNLDIIITLVMGIMSMRCISCLETKQIGIKQSCYYIGTAVAAMAVACFGFWYQGVSTDVFNPLLTARYEGYLRAFIANARVAGIVQPEGYAVQDIEKWAQELSVTTEAVSGQKPDLIVIMNEAFSDLGEVGDFETSEDYMPYIHGMSGEQVKKGWLVARRGSGTVYTESEFLLSTTAANYFGSIPYVKNIKSEIPSLVSVLSGQGYHTVAFHPEKGSNYCRSTVWRCMGFDEIMFKDGMTQKMDVYKEYCSDESDFRQVINLYETYEGTKPLLLFNVTMQNHSPYDADATVDKIKINSFDAEEDVENYLGGIKKTDEAYEHLIEYFSKVDRPVIVLMFGDHQPGIADAFYESVYGKSMSQLTGMESMKNNIVPYIMWTNYDTQIEDIGTVTANYLAPWLLHTAGLQMSGFEQAVWNMRKDYPVISTGSYVDGEGELHSYSESDSLPKWLMQYKMLTYNYIFDKKNRVDYFFDYVK